MDAPNLRMGLFTIKPFNCCSLVKSQETAFYEFIRIKMNLKLKDNRLNGK